jgi:hypothetical protein
MGFIGFAGGELNRISVLLAGHNAGSRMAIASLKHHDRQV